MTDPQWGAGALPGGAPPPPSPSPPPPPPFPPSRPRRRSLRVIGVLIVVVLLGAGTVAAVRTVRHHGPSYPSAWDPRVEPIVSFVERARGLKFEHPVAITFLSEPAFRKEVTADQGKLSDQDKQDLKAFEGVLRATGLVKGHLDLLQATNQLQGEGVLAFYDFERKKIFVRGTTLTVGRRVTLAHELTHALQDQHFDLSRFSSDSEDVTSGQSEAFSALVEGDAQRIEYQYVDTLNSDERKAYQKEATAEVDAADYSGVPDVLQATFEAPYVLGDALLGVLDDAGGNARVDKAFGDPPSTEEDLVDPYRYLAGDQPRKVETPALRAGEQKVDTGDFGALTWFLVLAERIDLHTALAAADGWGGDASLVYRSHGKACLRTAYTGDTEQDTKQMADALAQWAKAMPAGTAEVGRDGALVTLQTCDPGEQAATSVRGISDQVLLIPATRTGIALGLAQQGAPAQLAQCVADQIVHRLSDDQLLHLGDLMNASEVPADVLQHVAPSFAACGSPLPAGSVPGSGA